MFVIPVVLVSIFFLARSTLIVIGWLKSPVIRTFEQYGDPEPIYMPLTGLLFWAGVLAMALGAWASVLANLSFPLIVLGFLLILTTLLIFQHPERAAPWYYRLFKLPRWYHQLRDRTTRYERRRIAYAWLRMPWRAQLAYNSDDRAFFIWADYIIMGTVMDEEDALFLNSREDSV
jgi:hypothetical protein